MRCSWFRGRSIKLAGFQRVTFCGRCSVRTNTSLTLTRPCLHANYEGANGRTLIEMIREYVEMSQALQRNPLLGIQKIAARYDIDLFAFAKGVLAQASALGIANELDKAGHEREANRI